MRSEVFLATPPIIPTGTFAALDNILGRAVFLRRVYARPKIAFTWRTISGNTSELIVSPRRTRSVRR